MNHPVNELHKKTTLTVKLFLASALMAVTSVSAAEDNSVAYVDSVLKWGAWELDIEPAAGGISAPTPRALNTRSAKVTLRTNSIAALAPPPAPGSSNPIVPGTPVPVPPPIPVLPPVIPIPSTGPSIILISPNVPIPIGGPGGRPASAPTITTISPNVPIPVGGPGGIPSGGPGAS